MGFNNEELGNRLMALELLVIQYFRALANDPTTRASLGRLEAQTAETLSRTNPKGFGPDVRAWTKLMESILRPPSTQTKQ